MGPREFFADHAVFTASEFGRALGSRSVVSRNSLLTYHEGRGHLHRIRRGLYLSVSPGKDPGKAPVDPFLVAGKLAPDAILGYHTALAFYGKAYSVRQLFTYLTDTAARPFKHGEYSFRPVLFPKGLRDSSQTGFGVKVAERAGSHFRVTGYERTLVDVLDRLDLVGGWEEAWRSLEAVEFFDLEKVVEYATLLGVATTAAKVGLFLTQHRESFLVEERHLAALRKLRPRSPHYLEPRRNNESVAGGGKFVPDWNLVVPAALAERTWQEVA
jgi:predicted transcriptional regulator of viral defense system